jgi:hypothetical protein
MKTPHIHAEFIHAWADGATIQFQHSGNWVDCVFNLPAWDGDTMYRIKPESKPATVWNYNAFEGHLVRCDSDSANLKLTFDGETGKLKAAEVIE